MAAEYMHYPVNSKRELLTFLKEVDGITLSEKTYQNDYVAGYGRKLTNRIWAPVIESEYKSYFALACLSKKKIIYF